MNNFIRDYLVKLYIPRITWTDIIEIVIIAFVIYNVMVWIKNTKAWVLLKGIIIVVIFALIAYILNLKTILWIAGKTISVGIIALVIIFQPELRRALEQLGRKKILFGLFRFNDGREKGERFSSKTAEEIVRACFDMGAAYTGALIVIEQDMVLEEYEKKLGLYRQFEQQSQKTDEVLDYVKNKYPDDRKLIELVENLEKMEE